jgi:hypothetical protein
MSSLSARDKGKLLQPSLHPPTHPQRCRDITVRYKTVTLQNGTCYKTVHITKQYVFQNGTRYKTVRVTQRYVTKR